MKAKARDVEAYLDEAPDERKALLGKLRALCRKHLKGFEECIEYGMPSYKRREGYPEVAFASQKNYISLYILVQEVMKKHADALKGYKCGKGCINLSPSKSLDETLVRKLLEDTYASAGKVC